MTEHDPSSPIETILLDIRRAIDAKLYYPALLIALTMPDICMGLALPKAVYVKRKHYEDFIDTYTTVDELGLDGASCFLLRGGLVHRADLTGHANFAGSHVIFTVPESSLALHNVNIIVSGKTAAIYDLVQFCEAMTSAARRWYKSCKEDSIVRDNLKNTIRWCPDGVPPFLGGAPVVASGA